MAEKPPSRFAASVQFWRAKSAGSGSLPGNRAGQSGSAVAQGYPGTMPTGWYGHSPSYIVRHAVCPRWGQSPLSTVEQYSPRSFFSRTGNTPN